MIASSKILCILFLLSFAPLFSAAQHFNYIAALEDIDTTGFYSIDILPPLSVYIKTDVADVRIRDSKNQWVPHILRQDKPTLQEEIFTTLPILQNTVNDSGKNILIIENTKDGGIYNLELFLKNAAVSRTAILSGSNNQREWYIIDDEILLYRSYETLKDEYLQEINFPLVKYRYLKIIIDNVHNDPLLITRAGFYAQPFFNNLNIRHQNPAPLFIQKDSNNRSYIEVKQDNYHFDKIMLVIGGSKFYNREVEISVPYFPNTPMAATRRIIGNFRLLSSLPAIFELPRTRATTVFIVIKNADNPPLKVEKVSTQQQKISLVAYLERGQKYDLLLGDSLASFADYDLLAFKDSITNLHPLIYGAVHVNKENTVKRRTSNNKWWIWLSIIFAGIILSLLTYRLIDDINKQEK